jgi:hypothetical protein
VVALAEFLRRDYLYVGVWLIYPVFVYDFIIGFALGDYYFLFGVRSCFLVILDEPVQYLQGLSS